MDIRLVTLQEQALPGPLRADLDDLLRTAFDSVREPPLGRAWTHAQPSTRVVALLADDAVAGQVALVDAGRVRLAAGIADLIVTPAARGLGVSSALLDAALETPLVTDADVVFAASAHPGVRRHLARRAFRPARAFELYWVTGDGCHRNRDWIVRRESIEAVEVIGDV